MVPVAATSHYNIGNGVVKALLKAGHEVTVIQPYQPKSSVPNRHDIVVEVEKEMNSNYVKFLILQLTFISIFKFLEHMPPMDMFAFGKSSAAMQYFGLFMFTKTIADVTLADAKVQKLLNSNEKFDLVIYEVFGIDAFVGLGQHFGCPVIGYTTFGASIWYSMIMSNPMVNSYVPNPFLSYTADMDFGQRFFNTLSYFSEEIINRMVYFLMQVTFKSNIN